MKIKGGAALACLLLSGCFGGRLRTGLRKNTVVVEAAGSCPAGRDIRPCKDQAQRSAVAGLLGLYVPPETAAGPEAERGVLQKAGSFVKRWRVVESAERQGRRTLRMKVEVLHEKLGLDLDALGLVKPPGVEGAPKILISLREAGFAAGDVGRASDALRRTLATRGYAAMDLSDPLNARGRQSTGSRSEALAAGRDMRADVVVTGQASVVAAQESSEGYHTFHGRLAAEALLGGSGAFLSVVEAQAAAVDAAPGGAAAKALENSAELAGEKLAAELAERFRRRAEISVIVTGLERLEETMRLISAVRQVPGVAGVAAGKLGAGRAVLRVFVEKIGADELAARLIQNVRGFSLQLRGVEPDSRLVELESGSGSNP
jgi:hypothetical protein